MSEELKFYPPPPSPGGLYRLTYRLPPHLTCGLCVLQWRYVAGNSWGKCSNGTEAVGCGPQVRQHFLLGGSRAYQNVSGGVQSLR